MDDKEKLDNENNTANDDNNNIDNNIDNNSNDKKEDNRTIGEKLEDGIDEVMGAAEDAIYGTNPDFTNDIPATMVNGNERRVINKVQTRRNFNKRVFGKKGFKILFGILGAGIIITLIITLIEKALLA